MQSFLVEACYQDDFSRLLKNGISFLDLNSARNVLLDYCRRFMDEDTEKMRILSNTLDLKHSEDLLDTPTKNNLSERASGDLGSFLYGAIVADTVKRSIAELSVATTQVEMSSICIRKKREELYINELVPKLYLRNLPSSPQMYDFSENLRFYLESHKEQFLK